MTHYIHRPTPEGGETDPRFREVHAPPDDGYHQYWSVESRIWYPDYVLHLHVSTGTIWRIPGSDAPSAELLALAEAEKSKCEA